MRQRWSPRTKWVVLWVTAAFVCTGVVLLTWANVDSPDDRLLYAGTAVGFTGGLVPTAARWLRALRDRIGPRRRNADNVGVDWASAPAVDGEHTGGERTEGERTDGEGVDGAGFEPLVALARRRASALDEACKAARRAGLPVHRLEDHTAWKRAAPRGEPGEALLAALACDTASTLVDYFELWPPDEQDDLPELMAALEISRIGMRALQCLRDGRQFTLDRPCFHHPLHERGTEVVPHPPLPGQPSAADSEETLVVVCASCAAGPPRPLMIDVGGLRAPYWAHDWVDLVWRTSGYGACLEWEDPELLLTFFAAYGELDEPEGNEDELPGDPARGQEGTSIASNRVAAEEAGAGS